MNIDDDDNGGRLKRLEGPGFICYKIINTDVPQAVNDRISAQVKG